MLDEEVTVIEDNWSALEAVRDIVAGGTQEEPFYVCDLRELRTRHARWQDLMPRVEPFYAVKCNDDQLLLRTLAALGAGFDCASRGEIELLTNLGVAPERIIYANTLKSPSHMRYATSVGVNTVTFDCKEELIKIKQIMPNAQVVLRIRCDATVAQFYFGTRFGCDPITEAPALLKLAAALSLDVIGVSFHVGSDMQEPDAYARAIAYCRDVFALAAEAGRRMRLVDIGGGFPGGSGTSIKEISSVINAALDTHFPDRDVRVIAEPGRYFAAAAYTLAAMVHAKREIPAKDEASEAQTMYCINDGVWGSFNAVMTPCEKVKPILLYPNTENPQPCSIWGPTCSPMDFIVPAASLPPLQVGSWLLFKDMGAYTLANSTNFNGFKKARVKTFVDRCLWSMLLNQWPLFKSQYSAGRGLQALPCAADAGHAVTPVTTGSAAPASASARSNSSDQEGATRGRAHIVPSLSLTY